MSNRGPVDDPTIESFPHRSARAPQGYTQGSLKHKTSSTSLQHRQLSDADADADAAITGPEDNAGSSATNSTAGGRRSKSVSGTGSRGISNLTPEKLAKKRANDRNAQRAIRERTKSRIESLEQQVKELSSQKPLLDLQARVDVLQAENQGLRKGLEDIMENLQSLLSRETSVPCPPLFQPIDSAHASSAVSSTTQRLAAAGPSHAQPPNIGARLSTHTTSTTETALIGVNYNLDKHPAPVHAILDYQRRKLTHGLDFSSEEKLGFNFLLDHSRHVYEAEGIKYIYSQSGNTPRLVTSHSTPIRNIAPTCTLDAILLDFLQKRQREAAQRMSVQKLTGPLRTSVSSLLNPEVTVYSPSLSKVLIDVLRAFPGLSSLPEQVAVLYVIFLLIRWQIYPTQQNYDRLPGWLAPCNSQLLTPHPIWIDYLAWPRMRDRLVMSYLDYPFDNWLLPYSRTLSLNWPYEAADCLLWTADSDELVINPVFEKHLRNLSNWSLGPAFAESFPSLVDTTIIRPEKSTHNVAHWPT